MEKKKKVENGLGFYEVEYISSKYNYLNDRIQIL